MLIGEPLELSPRCETRTALKGCLLRVRRYSTAARKRLRAPLEIAAQVCHDYRDPAQCHQTGSSVVLVLGTIGMSLSPLILIGTEWNK